MRNPTFRKSGSEFKFAIAGSLGTAELDAGAGGSD